MRSYTAIPVTLIALCKAPRSTCSPELSPGILPTAVNSLNAYYNDHDRSDLHYKDVFWKDKTIRALRYVDIIATSTVALAIAFILLRCAAYIYDVSGSIKWAGRGLAAGGACGGEVSYHDSSSIMSWKGHTVVSAFALNV